VTIFGPARGRVAPPEGRKKARPGKGAGWGDGETGRRPVPHRDVLPRILGAAAAGGGEGETGQAGEGGEGGGLGDGGDAAALERGLDQVVGVGAGAGQIEGGVSAGQLGDVILQGLLVGGAGEDVEGVEY
jgi:hypothetical protein